MLRNDYAVYRAVLLVGLQAVVYRVVVVENLYLHAVVCRVCSDVCPYAHSVVHSRAVETEVEAQHKVAVLLLGVQIAASTVVCRDVDVAVFRHVVGGVALPFVERASVEQHLISLLTLFGGQYEHRSARQFAYARVSHNERVVARLEAYASGVVEAFAFLRVCKDGVGYEFLAVDAYIYAVVNDLYVG